MRTWLNLVIALYVFKDLAVSVPGHGPSHQNRVKSDHRHRLKLDLNLAVMFAMVLL